jgi:DNA invertase Pin-like site-specific DNA recombinase
MKSFKDFCNSNQGERMPGKNVGYVRVSSVDQNLARQLDGVVLDKLFEEKASGKDTNRPILQECLRYLRDGDVLWVHEISRLARTLRDLEKIVSDLNGRGVEVRFLRESLTFKGAEDPMSKLLFQILAGFSQYERALLKERQAEGLAAARRRGQKFGRPTKLTEAQKEVIRSRAVWGQSKKALAAEFGISTQLVYVVLKEGKQAGGVLQEAVNG